MILYGGAVIAACVTGAVVVIGWATSSNGKVTEFRQDWINGLREDVAALISNYTIYTRLDKLTKTSSTLNIDNKETELPHVYSAIADKNASALDRTRDLEDEVSQRLSEVIRLSNMVLMRLNPVKKRRSKPEKKLYKMLKKSIGISNHDLLVMDVELVRNSTKLVLKEEWKRVKNIKIFQKSLIISALAIIALVVYILPLK